MLAEKEPNGTGRGDLGNDGALIGSYREIPNLGILLPKQHSQACCKSRQYQDGPAAGGSAFD